MLPALSVLLLATPAADLEVPAELIGKAVQASDAGDWCKALPLYIEIHRRNGSLRALFNAAEVAYAHGDRVAAADLYHRIESSPGIGQFEHRATVRQRVSAVFRETQRAGPGVACPMPAVSCGDWILQAGEQCDDGNQDLGDGCDVPCVASGCGNGVVAPYEACDDANDVDGDGCDRGCKVSACGNGVVTSGEACDDGNLVDGDECDGNCTLTACGNGVLSKGEQCDDANAIDSDGCDRGCVVTRCGNGVVTAGERCDDGNGVDGDGCEASCTPTRRPAPLAGLTVLGVGASAIITGGVLLSLGVPQLLALQQATAAVEERRALFGAEPRQALDDIDVLRRAVDRARVKWDEGGQWFLGSGIALAGVGAVGAASGGWLATTMTEEIEPPEAPDDDGGQP